jgi:hypothetical protein
MESFIAFYLTLFEKQIPGVERVPINSLAGYCSIKI